jgi:hypothetical protein
LCQKIIYNDVNMPRRTEAAGLIVDLCVSKGARGCLPFRQAASGDAAGPARHRSRGFRGGSATALMFGEPSSEDQSPRLCAGGLKKTNHF